MPYPYLDVPVSVPTHTAYADVVSLRRDLGIASADAEATASLTDAIEAASRLIDGYCGYEFTRVDAVAHYAQLYTIYRFTRYPLVTVQSITDDAGNAITLTRAATYLFSGTGMQLLQRAGTSGDVTIAYTAGYQLPGSATPDLPADLQQAATELAREIYLRRSQRSSVSSESLPGVADVGFSVSLVQGMGMPAHVRTMLDRYRAIGV